MESNKTNNSNNTNANIGFCSNSISSISSSGISSIGSSNEYFARLANLLNNIEIILKKCSTKYKDKCEVEKLYTDLMVKINI